MSRLEGKVALITGATGGIGRAAAALFAEEGARVALVDLDEGALQEVARAIGEDRASYTAADVTRPDETRGFVNAAVERWGGVDVFLANAGIEGALSSIPDYPIEVFDRVMAVNVRGVWLGIKYVAPVMEKRGGGQHSDHVVHRRDWRRAGDVAVHDQQTRGNRVDADGGHGGSAGGDPGEHGQPGAHRDPDDAFHRGTAGGGAGRSRHYG